MHLTTLHLQNFRPFNDLTIEFNQNLNLNVLIGINGAGKSAILDAIAIALSPFLSRLSKRGLFQSEIQFGFKETDIKLGNENAKIRISVNGISNCEWEIKKSLLQQTVKNDFSSLNDFVKLYQNELLNNNLFNLPIIAYYPIERMVFDNSSKNTLKKKKYEYLQYLAYQNSLSPSINKFNEFIGWFAEEEGYEDKVLLEKDNSYRNPKLQTIRSAIELFLSLFETFGSSFSNIRIKKERNENGIKYYSGIVSSLVISKNGEDFELEQLSSGEKMIIMLVVDIAKKLTIANPSRDNPLEGDGIVLIDEIDLHLHPQWQRDIVPALCKTFPKCQFIITTHSPQVLSKIRKENIFIIEDNKIVKNTPFTYGKDSNSILFDIFNTIERPQAIQEKIDKCFRLLDEENYEAGQKMIEELSSILGENDSEIVRAKSLLTFYQA
jgi:predicted ATP-binding protein involved in virulence